MNKNIGLQSTLGKPTSKEFVRIKAKLKEHQAKSKQYDSLCYDIDDGKHLSSIVPYDKARKDSRKDCRQNSSPAKLIRSKSKTVHSNRKTDESNVQRNISDLYCELMTIKSEYKTLKSSYNVLLVQKNELTAREQTERDTASNEIQKCLKELQKQRKNGKIIQQQIERIKKECYKILQMERFKQKKLEEIIQEKDLMIAFLRNQIEKNKKGIETAIPSSINQSALSFLNNPPMFNYDFLKSSVNQSVCSNIVIEQGSCVSKSKGRRDDDSLSFSRDKSKDMDSIHSLLTNNDLTNGNFTKKDLVILQSNSEKSQTSQCLTFQQRDDEQNMFGHQPKKAEKINNLKDDKRKAPPSMPKQTVKQKGSRQNSTRLVITTDENIDMNTCESSIGTKKHTTFKAPSRFHKKTPTKRNKV